ncbi:MAG: hypothetical protein MHM6MM_009139 [Cercozoa sp. M6MM]
MAFDATQIEVSGYMVKRGEVRRSFKRRFCVIYHDGILEYYQREEQRGSNLNTMLGHLDLSSALSVGRSCEKSLQTPELAIDVVTPTRTWVFIAETYTDFAAWLKAMRRFCPRDCNSRFSLCALCWTKVESCFNFCRTQFDLRRLANQAWPRRTQLEGAIRDHRTWLLGLLFR